MQNAMISTIIIDDEQHAIESLKYELLENCSQILIVATTTNPVEGLELIKKLQPDLIFMDIEMPQMNGFELLSQVENNIDFDVIFVTAYDHYAIKAFKFSAVDYLLKPVNGLHLKMAVSLLEKRKYSFNNRHLKTLINNISKKDQKLEKIVLPTSTGLEFVEVNNIVRCESNGNYCKVHLIDKQTIFLAKTLKEIESLLFDQGFYRVHNSHLISMVHIVRYIHSDGGFIELVDNSKIPISRNRKKEFLLKFRQ